MTIVETVAAEHSVNLFYLLSDWFPQCEVKYDNVEESDCVMIEEEKCESKYETIYDNKCDTVYEPKVFITRSEIL